ncbi:uncharacterized protein LOC122848240 [Aphidius gifuensis]|uniref:uncharacterized protein LOC122848240 n=1 Tax=Aphidius gifuensis TaxID=684658 RepID=UPI001CDD3491|nr:uncharacterized protein LOC122848240 [Aphidius gifuensis]
MGCGSSGGKISEARLMTTKLNFSPEQLICLNDFFRKSVEEYRAINKDVDYVEATVERLVQRLISRISNLDKKFSSMFLISLNEPQKVKQLKFQYLLRIDALSTPVIDSNLDSTRVIVEEDSTLPGFVRLKIRDSEYWSEYLASDGRLKRDLVKAKLVALLAKAIKQDSIKDASESIRQSPGQIMNAATLHKILKQPDYCRIFFSTDDFDKGLSEPCDDHRVVLVEDSSGILLRIGLNGQKKADVEVRIFIGIGIDGWSTISDYPRRITLHHCDALLHYTAAQTGMYAFAIGPNAGTRCEDRATLWQIRLPAAETTMNQHYSDESVPILTESVLMLILDQLHGKIPLNIPMEKQEKLKVVSRYIIKTIWWWSLERTGPDPLISWSPDNLSRHVLHALDELVTALKCQNLRCYFYPRFNVILHSAKDGIIYHNNAYTNDSQIIENYLSALHEYSLILKPSDPRANDQLENQLILQWRRVMISLPRGTMNTHTGYNKRQLKYLSLIIKEILNIKNLTKNNECTSSNYSPSICRNDSIDNLIYLITLILRQARDQIFITTENQKYKRKRKKFLNNNSQGSSTFERSLDILIETVRRDRDTAYMDFDSEIILTQVLLKWLYFGMDNDRKVLGPILHPYLGNLFNSSHENAWHVESWIKRCDIYNNEINSLNLFCKLVVTQEITPASGIVDAISKGLTWAEHITNMIEMFNNSLNIEFLIPGKIIKYKLTFTNNRNFDNNYISGFKSWSKARNIGNPTRRATIARCNMITAGDTLPGLIDSNSGDRVNEDFQWHRELRDSSPLTHIVLSSYRRGRQRGPGGLISALVTLNKFRILQEAAAVLPHDDRILMLDAIQKVSREASRRQRKNSCPNLNASEIPRQIYRPRSENQLMKVASSKPPELAEKFNVILSEREKQLQKEIMEIHDTLTKGLRPSLINDWDSSSVLSWTSSNNSLGKYKRHGGRVPIWETRGTLSMWDRVECDDDLKKFKSNDVTSHEESTNFNCLEKRQLKKNKSCDDDDDGDDVDDEILPSWDFLETTLNQKLLQYTNFDDDKF